MKIFVTGGTTFVSRYTAEYFVGKGYEVTTLNRGTKAQSKGTLPIIADRTALTDELKGRHFDAVLDITAYTGEHVKALFDSGCSFDDYILLSSSAVYPETNIQPFSEDQLTGRNSVWGDYGTNKIKAEEEALSRFEGAYILRPPYLYGRYNNIYRETFVFDCADMDREFFVPKSNMKLQFFHVDDLCRMMEIILDSRPKQHILNVGNERLLSVKEWVSLCYRAAEKAAKIVEVPSIIPQRNYFPFCDYEYRLDVTGQKKLLSETIPHEQGLSDAYRWYREHKDAVSARRPYLSFIDKNLH